MTKQEVLVELRRGNGLLRGTVRPTTVIQLDKWQIDNDIFMVSTSEQWPNTHGGPKFVPRNYDESKLVRIEQLIELT